MRRFAAKNGFERLAVAMLLAIALLCAQMSGLRHAIAHAGLPAAAMHDASHHEGGAGAEHSCQSVDAATLAAGIPVPCYLPALLPGSAVLALWLAFASWDAPFSLHFSSRAPPRR